MPSDILDNHGAVSKECAEAMARCARERFESDIGIAVTGIAGPGGATVDKPVGTVFIAFSDAEIAITEKLSLTGDRGKIKEGAAIGALNLIKRVLRSGAS